MMSTPAITSEDLLKMSRTDLDEMFSGVPDPGPTPQGEAVGTVIFAPGTPISETAAKLAHLIAWQGKVFDPAKGELRNEIGPLGDKAVRAKVYVDESWFDGKPAIVLDYSKTSLVAHWIRDEIRQVSPGLYLGIVYWDHSKILDFALDFGHPNG
jgi:hypothetical protein